MVSYDGLFAFHNSVYEKFLLYVGLEGLYTLNKKFIISPSFTT